ncbi:hypothetical protein B0H14DRAFT_3494504 [Mycena olivaceomarginata]|nr:hypothetical protein B0H14DRAFT_3494504 [Mycena olivaceomarginata]
MPRRTHPPRNPRFPCARSPSPDPAHLSLRRHVVDYQRFRLHCISALIFFPPRCLGVSATAICLGPRLGFPSFRDLGAPCTDSPRRSSVDRIPFFALSTYPEALAPFSSARTLQRLTSACFLSPLTSRSPVLSVIPTLPVFIPPAKTRRLHDPPSTSSSAIPPLFPTPFLSRRTVPSTPVIPS